MAVRTETDTLVTACKLLTELAGDFPVYYALGNHEYKMFLSEEYRPYYAKYERALKKAGVHILRNGREDMVLQGEHFCFWGLELPIEYYHKPRSPKLKKEVMEEMIGKPDDKGMQILLAHNPKYGKTYFEWGADLILSGHYHGACPSQRTLRPFISSISVPSAVLLRRLSQRGSAYDRQCWTWRTYHPPSDP